MLLIIIIDEDNTTNAGYGICYSAISDGSTTTTLQRSAVNDGLFYNPSTSFLQNNGTVKVESLQVDKNGDVKINL